MDICIQVCMWARVLFEVAMELRRSTKVEFFFHTNLLAGFLGKNIYMKM